MIFYHHLVDLTTALKCYYSKERKAGVYCKVCGHIGFLDLNVLDEAVWGDSNKKCPFCGRDMYEAEEVFEFADYVDHTDYEKRKSEFENKKFILEKYVLDAAEYNSKGHENRIRKIMSQGLPECFEYVFYRELTEVLSLFEEPSNNVKSYIEKMEKPIEKSEHDRIWYCPRCGRLNNNLVATSVGKCLECLDEIPVFNRSERKKAVLVKSEFYRTDWEDYLDAPRSATTCTRAMYEYIWEQCVDIPENDSLNKQSFEKVKKEITEFLDWGGMQRKYPNGRFKETEKKDASVIGRGVVGGLVAGPVGAVVGAASALDKNAKNRAEK